MVEADSNSRNRLAVKGDHAEAEGDGHEEACQMVKMECVNDAAAGRSKGALDSEPGNQDHRKRPKQGDSHALEQGGGLGHQFRKNRKEVIQCTGRHNSPYGIRQASIAELALAACAAIAAFPSAIKRMWALIAWAWASRARLASMISCSARATSSLFVSCVLRTAIKSAALILFKTAISVFISGLEERESFSRFWMASSTPGAFA